MNAPVVEPSSPPEKKSKGGRNLPVAVGVGVALGVLALASLFVAPWGWLLLLTPAIVFAVLELRNGFVAGGHEVPLVPVVVGASVMPLAAYLGGPAALLVIFGVEAGAVIVWRTLIGHLRTGIRDIGSGVFVLGYVPFLASFTALMLTAPEGHWRVIAFVLVTVCSDIGGFIAGVRFGKTSMSPSVSPHKSWEGFAGSVVMCALAGAVMFAFPLGAAWWQGVLFGGLLAMCATLGDLTESMLKRDLGIKDFGKVLPGHGGLMDRMDSLLVCAPVAWIVMAALLPA
ncbi:Phosphatidate cytidylyltransferase [Dermatophilus congolensis]|uniref:Phosphatidate cytidylyltransferase n=1 Tax=Dermatophilus congolensis TaxID=1863 RepID=A0AA46BM13_9MICO|nr:phosphatidate cytidylyltransferase [Dermatophilus congolensis]STD05675.1 Phosphatidate cytidylyltransferase [Dermatophilus congolensis]